VEINRVVIGKFERAFELLCLKKTRRHGFLLQYCISVGLISLMTLNHFH